MKSFIGILFILFFLGDPTLLSVKEKLDKIPFSELPFKAKKNVPWPKSGFAIIESEQQNLPIFTYYDISMTRRNNYNEDVVVARKFKSEYKYCIVELEIGVSDPAKQLLVTYDEEGRVIDFLETGVYWGGVERLCVKQWQMDSERIVIVSWIKISSDKLLQAYDDFSSVKGERIDVYYGIDAHGKFYETKQVKYKPQAYTKAYLEDRNKNIWEGDEIVISD